jgi:hypothetical protein
VGVLLMAESSPRRSGALASSAPFSLPAAVRPLRAIPALIAVWSLGGLYGSSTALVALTTGHTPSCLAGCRCRAGRQRRGAVLLLARRRPSRSC